MKWLCPFIWIVKHVAMQAASTHLCEYIFGIQQNKDPFGDFFPVNVVLKKMSHDTEI